MRQLPRVPVKTEFIAFNGGLDTTTPPLNIRPGFCRRAQNYEQDLNGGYRRIDGYERFDGRTKPSDAIYAVLTCTITGTVAVGDILCDSTGAVYTGTVIALPTGQAVLTKMTGTWPSSGSLYVSTDLLTQVGTFASAPVTDGASTSLLHSTYLNLAADEYRADIGEVPGSGPILGVWVYNDEVYAFRNNAFGIQAVGMYKATNAGWVGVDLGEEIEFTNASANLVEDETLTQGGVTATIERVVIQSGSLDSGENSGRLILSGRAGGNFSAGAATTPSGTVTLGGQASSIGLPNVNGTFEFVNANFGGTSGTLRMYGVDGQNRGFEFDGTVFVPIETGMVDDAPSHVAVHQNQLFYSFGASVQHSAPGDPYMWSPIVGAGELALGDDVEGFAPVPGTGSSGAMAIMSRNSTYTLYGTGVIDWNLVSYKNEAGGYARTLQLVSGRWVMFDERGICDLRTSQNYGNFEDSELSTLIKNELTSKTALDSTSVIIRNRNQYRLFFSDRSAFYVTFSGGNVMGIMPMLYNHPVVCACSAELSNGSEVMYFGSDDGYVYQMDKGTSFDGEAIEAYIYLSYNHSGSPRAKKRYRQAALEVSLEGYSSLYFNYELMYGTETKLAQPVASAVTFNLTTGVWDTGYWDTGYWDGRLLDLAECDMTGSAENCSLILTSSSDSIFPHRISGAIVHYSDRVQMR